MQTKDILIFKICHKSEWQKAKKIGKFFGSNKDREDGFIHFSTKNQIKSTIEKYFVNYKDLVILEVDSNLLNNLLWEKSRDGLFFPHLYSSYLNINAVINIYD